MPHFNVCCRSKSKNNQNKGQDSSPWVQTSYTNSTSINARNITNHDGQSMDTQTLQDGSNSKQSVMKQQTSSYARNDSNDGMSSTKKIDSIEEYHVKPEKNLSGHMKAFLQHQQEFFWFTKQFDHSAGSDHFRNMVVHSTFPVDLSKSDFGCYIDATFNDFPQEIQRRMKDLYQQASNDPVSEELIINESSNGAISATLIQILSHKNDRDELEMLVGSVGVTQRPPDGCRFSQFHWKQYEEKVTKALQYMYAKEALKELPEE
ncbi:unnamed protein product [Adineta ricciae]|uniref:Uncharacterized protein n=1 Tax=Adineta ricciae TaxID=249248 RepID=A0A814B6V1_ADIRI|nr:unnamed protein product [Adineta ricciae]CAF0924406.1 unnamed protein product [Adineta ricciae]